MNASASDVLVAGVGMVPFLRPREGVPYDELGSRAVVAVLEDSGVDFADIQQAYIGYVYGDSCAGQRALYRVGMSGIPVFNVNNNCSTGSSALFLARQAIASGAADCVLALGFEQMTAGALGVVFDDRVSPLASFDDACNGHVSRDLPMALRYFGGAGQQHMQRYGTQLSDFAKVRAKASRHAANNPLAMFRSVVTEEEVLADQEIWPGVMTRLMACPPSCGGAAAILVSREFANRRGIDAKVRIKAQAMTSDTPESFAPGDMINLVGSDMTKRAARAVYAASGIGPEDIGVAELHDCFAHNEVISYEGLGFCEEGQAARFIADGDNSYGGKVVTNPSGGLLSKGHPLGATGLAQCYELTHQLRGTADKRQVEGVRHALQHNLGLGGACVVTMYEAV